MDGHVQATPLADQTEILQAMLSLVVHSPAGKRWEGMAIVDTGFSDCLGLSSEVIQQLGLRPYEVQKRQMANGAIVALYLYKVGVIWHGKALTIDALGVERNLIGSRLLRGSLLTVEMVPEGGVSVQEMPLPETP